MDLYLSPQWLLRKAVTDRIAGQNYLDKRINDRVVYCTHLESERASRHHGFESYFIRVVYIIRLDRAL